MAHHSWGIDEYYIYAGYVRISREVSIGDVAPILISVGTLIWVALQTWEGPQILLHSSDKLYLIADQIVGEEAQVRLGADVSYQNTAPQGFNAAIRSIFVEFDFKGNIYRQEWQSMVFFDAHDDIDCKQETTGEASSQAGVPDGDSEERTSGTETLDIGASHRLNDNTVALSCGAPDRTLIVNYMHVFDKIIEGATGEAYEIFFEPVDLDCETGRYGPQCKDMRRYLSWNALLKAFPDGEEDSTLMNFKIGIELIDGTVETTACSIRRDTVAKVFLEDNGWHMFECAPPSAFK